MLSQLSKNAFEQIASLQELEARQIFFIGGAPRSGTTWIQHLIDGHPEASCMGEGLFWQQVYYPLTTMIENWRTALQGKNRTQFSHTGGYPLPDDKDRDLLLATSILKSFQRQLATRADGGTSCLAVGEKTPEDIFLFLRLRYLFPQARLIVISRDPRDVLASAWHMFIQRHRPDDDLSSEMENFVRNALGPMERSARALFTLKEQDPACCLSITYEELHANTADILASAFRFLGLSAAPEIVKASIERSSFSRLSGGRERGTEEKRSFLRQGIVGGWSNTLTEQMNDIILEKMGWTFTHFGWTR